ncbi:MAG: hypothetical protein ACR2GD_10390 [Pyrinomonadaceae bacterium]
MFEYSEEKNPVAKYVIWGGVIIVIIAPLIFIAFLSSDLLDFGLSTPHPSDEVLIKNFQNNENDFEKLNQMAKEDSDFVRIANDFNWTKESIAYPRPKSEKDLSEKRWNEYRSLFRKLNLKMGIINSQPEGVGFLASTKGMVTGGSEKGYMYLIEEPFPIVDSLDEPNFSRPELEGRNNKILYRKLKDNWYLYYLVD